MTDEGNMHDLSDIGHELRTQDNLATAHPIFVVQQRDRIYGMDTAHGCQIAWVHEDEIVEVDASTAATLEAQYDETGDDTPIGYKRLGYIDRWEFVQPFFTNKAAEVYITANHHRLTEPRVYVDSAYRNTEWQRVRAALSEQEPTP